jgi:hypothetical protein
MYSDWQKFGAGLGANGQQAELCGELIDTNRNAILCLAQRFGLATAGLLRAQPSGTKDTNLTEPPRDSWRLLGDMATEEAILAEQLGPSDGKRK